MKIVRKNNEKQAEIQKQQTQFARPIFFACLIFLIAFLFVLQNVSWQLHGAKGLFRLSLQFHGAKRLFLTILAVSQTEATLLAVSI